MITEEVALLWVLESESFLIFQNSIKTHLTFFFCIQSNFCWGHPLPKQQKGLEIQRRRLSATWRMMSPSLTHGKVCFPLVCLSAWWINSQRGILLLCRLLSFDSLYNLASPLTLFLHQQKLDLYSTESSCPVPHLWKNLVGWCKNIVTSLYIQTIAGLFSIIALLAHSLLLIESLSLEGFWINQVQCFTESAQRTPS